MVWASESQASIILAVDERSFIETSQDVWGRLATSVERARRTGVARLDATEVRRLHEDYRRTAADLAYAQTHYPDTQTHRYLNDLVAQAHAELYGAAPRSAASIWDYITRGYPRLIRKHGRQVLLSALLLGGATALGFLLAHINYPLARMFIPEMLREGVGDAIEQGGDMSDIIASMAPLLAVGITANNVQVSLLAFAGGMTFGTVTVYALVFNGLMLGVLGGVFAKADASLHFWSLIVPHGSLELPAIVLAGASGLLLAKALISPGDLPRSSALKATSGEAVQIVLGAIPLLIIAGIIEGFLTPSAIDPMLKLAFGAIVFVMLLLYILLPGRRPTVARAP